MELKQKRTEAQERVDKEAGSGADFQEACAQRFPHGPSRLCPLASRPGPVRLPGQTWPLWPDIGLPVPAAPVGAIPSPAMPSDLSGTWNLLSSDNVEGYMRALGRREGQCGGRGAGVFWFWPRVWFGAEAAGLACWSQTVVGLPPPTVCQSFSPAACSPNLRPPAFP